MIDKIKKLLFIYKDVIFYAIFGVLTTLVNIISFWVSAHALHFATMTSTIMAWMVAVLFAYLTNRKWVFHSTATNTSDIVKEIISFFSCRLATGIVDWICMFLFVDCLQWNDMVIKFGANVLVIILNYVASKLLIFKKEGK